MKHLSVSAMRKKLKILFSQYIRRRDWHLGCISCGNPPGDPAYWQAGHFFDTAVCYASLDFHEKNINGQCHDCNNFAGGNKDGYKAGLILRYGPDVIDELEAVKLSRELWGFEEFDAAIKKYQGILKGMMQ